MTLDAAKKRLRYEAYERKGFAIDEGAYYADQLREAMDLVLQRLNRLESIFEILKRLEEIA